MKAAHGSEKCPLCKRPRCSMCGCGEENCTDYSCDEEECGQKLYSKLDQEIGTCVSCRDGIPRIVRDDDE